MTSPDITPPLPDLVPLPPSHRAPDEPQAVHDRVSDQTADAVHGTPATHAADPREADEPRYGPPGPPLNRRSPFFVGLTGAAGVAVTYALVQLAITAQTILLLVGLSLFLAIGLEPAVAWFSRHRVPRWAGIAITAVVMVGFIGGFLALAIPAVVEQGQQLSRNAPDYLNRLRDHSSFVGQLNDRLQLESHLNQLTKGDILANGLLGAGRFVISATAATITLIALTLYFLAGLPAIKRTSYRFVPASRRARTVLLTEDALAKVGAYVLGNLFTSFIAGVVTLAWLLIFHVPYPLLLAVFVALMDLVPIVGTTIAGIVVSLVALTVSLPVALATVGFYVAYRVVEDYLIVPRVMGRAVNVPGVVTLLALLIGGTLLGVAGALIAIPIAAAGRLIVEEVLFPRLDHS